MLMPGTSALGRENGEIVPHAFSSEAFRLAIESDMEIR